MEGSVARSLRDSNHKTTPFIGNELQPSRCIDPAAQFIGVSAPRSSANAKQLHLARIYS